MADYTGETNKFGNTAALPFSSYPTGEGVLDLAFSAEDLTRLNDLFWLDGVRQDSADWAENDGAVLWTNGFNVVVQPFRAHVNGTMCFTDVQTMLTLEAEAVSSRIDSIIIRRDYLARTVNVMVLKGTSGSGVAPTLTRNDMGVYDYELARVTVTNTMPTLSQSDITDMRTHLVADIGIRPTAGNAGAFIGVAGNGSLKISGYGEANIESLIELTTELEERVYLTDSWRSADGLSWYRKYSDGWVEQGGRLASVSSASTTTVNLFIPFADTNYAVQMTIRHSGGSNVSSISIGEFTNNKTTTSFQQAGNASGTVFQSGAYWEAKGQGVI